MTIELMIFVLLIFAVATAVTIIAYITGFYRGYKRGLVTGEDGIIQQIIKQGAGIGTKSNAPMGFHPNDDDPLPTKH
jgi:hypothetical protein